MTKQNGMKALRSAIKVAGSQAELARRIDVTRGQINHWLNGDPISAKRCVDIERATGVDRSLLRPDLFSRDHAA